MINIGLVLSRGVLRQDVLDNATKQNCWSAIRAYYDIMYDIKKLLLVGGIFQNKDI